MLSVGMQKMYRNKVTRIQLPYIYCITNTKVIDSLSGECNLRGQ